MSSPPFAARAAATAIALPLALAAASLAARADNDGVQIDPSAEVVVRYRHFEGHDFTDGGVTETVRQRARVGLSVSFLERVGAFVQVQDVRTWGEEGDTLGDYDADGLDMHQGYLDFAISEGMKLRVGRQEIAYLNQRLIGSVGFAEQARSFDAARWSLVGMGKDLAADLFYARTRDGAPDDFAGATDVLAGFLRYRVTPGFVPALIVVSDISGPTDRVRVTGGLVVVGVFDFGLAYQVEGYFQGGSAANDVSYAAWFAAARARYTLDFGVKPYLELFADVASGDDDPPTATSTPSTRSSPRTTSSTARWTSSRTSPSTRSSAASSTSARPSACPSATSSTSSRRSTSSRCPRRGGSGSLGVETDIKGVWRLAPHLTWDLVYAVFVPGDGLTGGGPSDPEHFVYSTLAAVF